MHRNLDRRVEALIRIEDQRHIEELIALIKLSTADTTSSWRLQPDGTWLRVHLDDDGERLTDIQEVLMAQARRRVAAR
jgi:polyphosphate kinase